jgi:hypothetical protein
VLGTAANGLYRRPHVAVFRKQVPASSTELIRVDAAALVDALAATVGDIEQSTSPCKIAIAPDDTMRAAVVERFLGIQRCVYAAENDNGTAFAGRTSEGIAT